MSSQDIHSIQIVPGSPRRLLACTNNDLNLSVDEGQTWVPQGVAAKFGNGYCRSLSGSSADPNLVFLGNGNGPPGTLGTLQISRDGGVTWAAASLPVVPNSTIWDVAICADVVFAISINGYVYRSVDKGVTWAKCRHEFGEVRTIAVV